MAKLWQGAGASRDSNLVDCLFEDFAFKTPALRIARPKSSAAAAKFAQCSRNGSKWFAKTALTCTIMHWRCKGLLALQLWQPHLSHQIVFPTCGLAIRALMVRFRLEVWFLYDHGIFRTELSEWMMKTYEIIWHFNMNFYLSTIANLSTILARVVVLARRMVLIWHLINFESGYLCTFQLANLCVASHSAYENPRRGLRLSVQDWHSQQHSQCPAKAGEIWQSWWTVLRGQEIHAAQGLLNVNFALEKTTAVQRPLPWKKWKDCDLRQSDSWSFPRGGLRTWNQVERHLRTINADQIMVPSLAFFGNSIHVKVKKEKKGRQVL